MSPTIELKLTEQEQNILNYLTNKESVAWEELAQFSKSPTTVKRSSLLKVVSDLKKKYTGVGLSVPFTCQFTDLVRTNSSVISPSPAVQMRKTLGGNLVRADDPTPDAHHDFKIDKNYFKVKTIKGWIPLNESSFELFTVFHENAEVLLSKEELKNKIWYQWGSKTPASWWSNLQSRMTNLRTCLPELKYRLQRVVVDGDSSFMLK